MTPTQRQRILTLVLGLGLDPVLLVELRQVREHALGRRACEIRLQAGYTVATISATVSDRSCTASAIWRSRASRCAMYPRSSVAG